MLYEIEISRTLRELLQRRAECFSDTPVFVYWNPAHTEQIPVTSAEFFGQTERLGAWLLAQGYRGRKLAILGENSYAWLSAFFAITNSGNVAVLLDKNLSAKVLKELIESTDCDAVFFSASYQDTADILKAETGLPFLCLNDLLQRMEAGQDGIEAAIDEFRQKSIQPDDPAVIAFTSGTSGKNKGVILSHENVASDVTWAARYTKSSGKALHLLPFYHMFGILGMLGPVVWGGTVYINQGLRYIVQDVIQVRPVLITAVPAMLPLLYRGIQSIGSGIGMKIISGGAPADMTWMQRFRELGVRINNGYGMTECAPCIAMASELYDRDDGSMKVIDGWKVRIDEPDEDGCGEILVKGSNVMKGYYRMEDETREALRDGWMHTGDLGKLDAEGFLSIVGRKKNLLVLPNGENVSPEELERMVQPLDGVAECLASAKGGCLQMEVYAPGSDENKLKEAILNLNHLLPSAKRIKKILFRQEEFPKNSSMKILR